jgi:hypothetical protein
MRRSNAESPDRDEVRVFIEEVLRIGVMLTDLVTGLADDLPEEAFPGENSIEVLVEMLAGTIRPAANAAGVETLRQATALVGAVGDRVLSDLRLAADRACDGRESPSDR